MPYRWWAPKERASAPARALSRREHEVVQDQQPGELIPLSGFTPAGLVGGRPLELGEVLQVTQRRGPLGLDDALDVDVRHGHGQGQLDDQLVPWCVATVDRGVPPTGGLGPALIGQAIGDSALGVRASGTLDQSVTLKPVQSRIDLPDVERPGATGA